MEIGRVESPKARRAFREQLRHKEQAAKPQNALRIMEKKPTKPRTKRNKKMSYKPFIFNNVKLIRVVDGDTIELEIIVGFGFTFQDKFRLKDIDAPEVNRKATREAGNRSKLALEQMILEEVDEGEGIWIESFKKDSFGRWLCRVYSHRTGDNLNQRMITEGYAVPYKR